MIHDHHVDNGLYTETVKVREIRLLGSACTLLIPKVKLDDELAQFLSAPLMLDSYNFSDNLKGSKWVEEDLQVFEGLQKEASVDLKTIWKELDDIK